MQPFVGPDDKTVLASVARLINQGDVTSDIAQAPHHFEVWRLATVTPEGHIEPDRELLQDCAALVRRDLRGYRVGRDPESPGAEISHHRGPESLGGQNGANPRPVQGPPPGGPEQATEAPAAAR